MAKKWIVAFLLVALFSVPVLQAKAKKCGPTKKQRIVTGLFFGALGAVVGAAASHNKGLGAGIGAGASGAVGAAAVKNPACAESRSVVILINQKIAPANAPQPRVLNGPSVVIAGIDGISADWVKPYLIQGLAHEGYSLIGGGNAASSDENFHPDYALVLSVRRKANGQAWGGNAFARASFFSQSNANVAGASWAVSITMTIASGRFAGRIDPTRSIEIDVPMEAISATGNNYFSIGRFGSYGGYAVQADSPEAAAAEYVVAEAFGLVKQK